MKQITKKIFISSTVNELEYERNYLKNAIQNIKNDYVNFEACLCDYTKTFNLTEQNMSNDDPINICLQKVEECDYYLLMIKREYKYKRKLHCSVTELEYNKAKELHKPIIVFIFNNVTPQRYAKAFIERVRNEKWSFFINHVNDIENELSNLLNNFDSSKFISENPKEGIYFKKHANITKTWIIKNSGNKVWENRYMKEIMGGDIFKPNATKISIPKTLPNEEFVFIVEYSCLSDGDYYSLWKMFDSNDKPCFPNEYIGLWVNAYIR